MVVGCHFPFFPMLALLVCFPKLALLVCSFFYTAYMVGNVWTRFKTLHLPDARAFVSFQLHFSSCSLDVLWMSMKGIEGTCCIV